MQEVTHSELITKARNCESMMVLYCVDGEGNEEGFCVNPTDEMREQMAFEASELADESEEDDAPAAEGTATEGTPPVPTGGPGQAPETPDPADPADSADKDAQGPSKPDPDKA